MSFKTKAIGIVAASILGVSAFGGAALAETSTATFNPNPNGSCTAAATTSNVDFGTYTWNGEAYVAATQPTLDWNVNSTYGPGSGCNVTIQSSDLTSGANSISADDVLLDDISGGTQGTHLTQAYLDFANQVVTNGAGDYTSNVRLNGLYGPHYQLGTYTGTLTFTATQYVP